jgi:hypothetical protein
MQAHCSIASYQEDVLGWTFTGLGPGTYVLEHRSTAAPTATCPPAAPAVIDVWEHAVYVLPASGGTVTGRIELVYDFGNGRTFDLTGRVRGTAACDASSCMLDLTFRAHGAGGRVLGAEQATLTKTGPGTLGVIMANTEGDFH